MLTRGQVTLVDDEDYEWLNQWKWYAHKGGSGKWYAVRWEQDESTKDRITVRMHRVIIGAKKGEGADHKDRNSLDNQRHNLRFCTRAQNNQNAALRKDSTSGYKGVSFYELTRRWKATIGYNNKLIHLGYYDTSEEAARVYDAKAVELFGEFAKPNFPRRITRK